MPCELREVQVGNFKSLRDLQVTLGKFNVIVGRNASGKTNFLEFFKFLRDAVVEEHRPYMPQTDWWRYHNILWQGNEQLPITAKLRFDVDGQTVNYEITFKVAGATLDMAREAVIVPPYVSLVKEGRVLRIEHDKNFLRDNSKEIESMLQDLKSDHLTVSRIGLESLASIKIEVPEDFRNLVFSFLETYHFFYARSKDKHIELSCPLLPRRERKEEVEVPILVLPHLREFPPTAVRVFQGLRESVSHFTVLRHPSMKEVKSPSTLRREDVLLEDSTNLNSILFYWSQEKGSKIPERIERGLKELFPGVRVMPHLTADGKVFTKIYERGVELDPPSIPDGFYKVLTILSAVELKPSLLAIDEVENSLYGETLEYIIDELQSSETTVILTTHSPMVVDMIRLEDLLMAEGTAQGTTMRRISDPVKLKEKLRELKITQSESWLYGDLAK